MKQFQSWMAERELRDEDVAPLIGVSRVQISRIRRSKTGASKPTAMKLEVLTGIPWFEFIEPNATSKAA